MYDSARRARERIITMEIMKLERRQASARNHPRAEPGSRAGSGEATPASGARRRSDGHGPAR